MKRFLKIRIFIVFAFCSSVLSLFFSNCGKIEMTKPATEGLNEISSASVKGSLMAPTKVRAHSRLILFVDHSQSMVFQRCPEDLDGSKPSLRPLPCIAQAGPDYLGKRYDYLLAWLKQIWLKNEPDVKVLILPFSGGIVDTNRIRNEASQLEFLSLESAMTRLQKLKLEQEDEKLNPNRSYDQKKMGTSVPSNMLSLAKAKINAEIKKLLQEKTLYSSLFEFYFISDGEFKPTTKDVTTAMNLLNCPVDCVMDPTMVTCGNQVGETGLYDLIKPEVLRTLTSEEKTKLNKCLGVAGNNLTVQFTPGVDLCFCIAIGTKMAEIFGRAEDNTLTNIMNYLLTISVMPEYYGEGQFRMNFIRITDPGDVRVSDGTDLFAEAKKNIPDARFLNFKDMAGAVPQAAVPLTQMSYKIEDFYALNLNLLQNAQGVFVPDSDGDGLADEDEARLGFDPLLSRSDRQELPYCLDGIKAVYGCRTSGCDAALDQDGDGLNECEEMTLNTSTKMKDTSADGILDALKVLKGLSPLLNNEKSDTNTDAISDKQAFKWGLHPLVKAGNFPEKKKIQTQVEFLGYQAQSGSSVSLPQYKISVANIPLVHTLKVDGNSSPLYFDRFHQDPIAGSDILLSGNHEADVNQILLVVKVRAFENKDRVYWLVYRLDLRFGDKNKIEVNLSDFYELRNTGWDL